MDPERKIRLMLVERIIRKMRYVLLATTVFIVVKFTIHPLKFALDAKARINELDMISEFWLWVSIPIARLFMVIHLHFVMCADTYGKFSSGADPSL
jgi:hypothetical protein